MLRENPVMPYRFGDVEVDSQRRTISVRGKACAAGARAFDLLVALIERRERVVSKEELIDLVWPQSVVEENNVQVHVSALRRLLGPATIATIAGRGYRFTVPVKEDSSAPGWDAQPPSNFSVTRPELIGREVELRVLMDLVRTNRLVTTCGAGGMGKTTLANAAAQGLRHLFAEGVWQVELAPVAQQQMLPTAVARALNVSLDVEGQADAVANAIASRRLLVVLDSCEHLLPAAARLVASMLRAAPGVSILVTSQEPLKVHGEHVFRLPPLTLPAEPTVELARQSGAVGLFTARATAADPRFELSQQNVSTVIDICRRLDGIPLAIELAAARLPLLGLSGLAARIHERFHLLTGGARLALPRHQTLRAAMEWSHGLLTAAEQRLFRRLGVFVGNFSLDSAQEVTGQASEGSWETLELLGSLVDKSLVVAEPGESPRYRLLETTRAYALERLEEAGELELMCLRHARAIAALFERSRNEEYEGTIPSLLARYLPDLDNGRAALEWLASRPAEGALHVALAGAMAWIWVDAGLRPEGIRRTRAAVERIEAQTPPLHQARLLISLARVSFPLAGADLIAGNERALAILRDAGKLRLLCPALLHAGVTLVRAGRLEQAAPLLKEAGSLLDPTWPPALRASCFAAHGQLHDAAGRMAEGRRCHEEALALSRQAGDMRRALRSMINIEQDCASTGAFEDAVALGRQMRDMLRADPSLKSGYENVILGNLGMALTLAGALDEAVEVAREAYAPVQRAGRAFELLDPYAMLAFKRGHAEDAARMLGRSILRFAQADFRRFFVEQRLHDELLAELQRKFGPGELARLFAEGEALTDDQAVQLALGK